MNSGLKAGVQKRISFPQLVLGPDDQPPKEWGRDAKLIMSSEVGALADLVFKKAGPLGASNVGYDLSHQISNKDLLLYAYDGTTFKNFLQTDWTNHQVKFFCGLELAHPSLTPYIDFHRSADPGEGTDFNVRLINDGDNTLALYGDLRVGRSAWIGFFGQSPAYGTAYAQLSHSAKTGGGDYCLLHQDDGSSYLNAGPSGRIRFRNNNNDIADITGSEIRLGIDTFDYRTLAIRYNQQGDYGHSALIIVSNVNESRIAFWAQGQGNAPIFKNWFANFECRTSTDGGYTNLYAANLLPSRAAFKDDISSAVEYLSKTERRRRIQATRTVHYRWKPPAYWCANCLGTGTKVGNVALPEMERVTIAVAALFGHPNREPCPTCHGDPHIPPAYWAKGQESGWYGFIVEEITKTFPEAVGWRDYDDGKPPVAEAIEPMTLIAVLWEEVKDLGTEVKDLGAQLAIAEATLATIKKGK